MQLYKIFSHFGDFSLIWFRVNFAFYMRQKMEHPTPTRETKFGAPPNSSDKNWSTPTLSKGMLINNVWGGG